MLTNESIFHKNDYFTQSRRTSSTPGHLPHPVGYEFICCLSWVKRLNGAGSSEAKKQAWGGRGGAVGRITRRVGSGNSRKCGNTSLNCVEARGATDTRTEKIRSEKKDLHTGSARSTPPPPPPPAPTLPPANFRPVIWSLNQPIII